MPPGAYTFSAMANRPPPVPERLVNSNLRITVPECRRLKMQGRTQAPRQSPRSNKHTLTRITSRDRPSPQLPPVFRRTDDDLLCLSRLACFFCLAVFCGAFFWSRFESLDFDIRLPSIRSNSQRCPAPPDSHVARRSLCSGCTSFQSTLTSRRCTAGAKLPSWRASWQPVLRPVFPVCYWKMLGDISIFNDGSTGQR